MFHLIRRSASLRNNYILCVFNQLFCLAAEFFAWMNQPNCDICNNGTQGIGSVPPSVEDKRWGAGTVENYICRKCNKTFTFPRYNHPQKLLGKFLIFAEWKTYLHKNDVLYSFQVHPSACVLESFIVVLL